MQTEDETDSGQQQLPSNQEPLLEPKQSLPSSTKAGFYRSLTGSTVQKYREWRETPLEGENLSEDVQKQVDLILAREKKPYVEKARTRFSGPIRLGTSVPLREDFFSIAWLYWMHIEVLTG